MRQSEKFRPGERAGERRERSAPTYQSIKGAGEKRTSKIRLDHKVVRWGVVEMMKKLATGLALALMCVPAMADSGAGFYGGASGSMVTLKDSTQGIRVKESGTGYSIFGGYRFGEYGSVEVAYLEGDGDDTVYGVKIETDANAIMGSLLLQIPVTPVCEGFVRAGMLAWDAEHFATNGRQFASMKVDGTDWILGIGAAWHVTPKFGIRAEYGGADLDGSDLRLITLGGLLRF